MSEVKCMSCDIGLVESLMHKITVKTPTTTTIKYLCEACKNTADDTLAVHGIVLGAIIAWKDEATNEVFVEVVIDGEHQVDGQGNFITTVNSKGVVDETHMTSVIAFRNAPDSEWIDQDITDVDYSELDRLARVFGVDLSFENAEIHRMVIACNDACGEPDLPFVKVLTTQEDALDEGLDIDLAIQWAEENGYNAPFVVFNCDHNSAGSAIANKFTWETATVYKGKD